MTDISIILVAEDNDFVRMQIVKYLQEAGHKIVEASDGNAALRIVESQEIHMAIVDVRMEPVDGFTFVRALRGMESDIPVILVTGDNAPDILEKSGDWNVSAVLIKPVEKERLVKAVERSLAVRKKRAGA
ncbi:MAG: response regulator [Alphaproteobacteria bacterium]|nr:response regulator [Alphaproteobacteria bacterium]